MGLVEGARRAHLHRVRHGPVDGVRAAELLVRPVAHGDDEVARRQQPVDLPRLDLRQLQVVPSRGGERTRRDALPRVRPGRHRVHGAGRAPQRRGEMRAGRVGGAHEDHALGCAEVRRGRRLSRRPPDERDVGPAAVALRAVTAHQPGVLEHPEVVREQVGREAETPAESRDRTVGECQRVDDPQPGGVRQRRVPSHPTLQLGTLLNVHCLNLD
ncbi:hypothetical protein BJF86_02970 [Serinicoccus sp. CNJ-927]|nr:hypothetical protein BJF86_02970 [Serinicoccus sp. CNJ-927]